MATPQKWVIVGGDDRGGVLVREGQELGSPKAPDRLSTGAIVEELRLVGERMLYKRLTGTGPEIGWISVYLNHKDLAQRLPPELEDGPSETSRPAEPPKPPEPPGWARPAAEPPGWWEPQGEGAQALDDAPAEGEQENKPPEESGWNAWMGDAATALENGEAGEGEQSAEGKAAAEAEAEAERARAEARGPARFADEAATKLPADVSDDLKWLAWNEIWRVVNNKLGSINEGQSRKDYFSQAEKDEERSCQHLRQALEANAFSNPTVLQVKRQASAGGHAVAAGARRGNWLMAARHDALEQPQEMVKPLWDGLVKAIRTAAVAIHMMSRHEWQKGVRFQDDYEEAWTEISERSAVSEPTTQW